MCSRVLLKVSGEALQGGLVSGTDPKVCVSQRLYNRLCLYSPRSLLKALRPMQELNAVYRHYNHLRMMICGYLATFRLHSQSYPTLLCFRTNLLHQGQAQLVFNLRGFYLVWHFTLELDWPNSSQDKQLYVEAQACRPLLACRASVMVTSCGGTCGICRGLSFQEASKRACMWASTFYDCVWYDSSGAPKCR